MFYLAQILGVIALVFLLVSFQINKKETLLKYQIFSSFFFSVQYLCLNAITGCLMNLMTLVRNIIHKKYKNNIPIMYLLLIIFAMIIISIFSYNGLVSLLPTVAVILYSIALWQKNLTITRLVEIFSCLLFILYNIKVLAISGFISTVIELILAIMAVYRFDLKNKFISMKKTKEYNFQSK